MSESPSITHSPPARDLHPALGLLLLAALAMSLWQVFLARQTYLTRGPVDQVSASESRFAEARESLPGFDELGYLTDAPYPAPLEDPSVIPDYYLAQYSLIPMIVVRDPEKKVLIGNFTSGPAPARLRQNGAVYVLVRDFGAGVALMSRSEP